jgi:hypothetical protein
VRRHTHDTASKAPRERHDEFLRLISDDEHRVATPDPSASKGARDTLGSKRKIRKRERAIARSAREVERLVGGIKRPHGRGQI